MDVTEEYLYKINQYGGSEQNQDNDLAASNSLVYAKGPTMQRAVKQTCSTIPFEFQYRGEIGLFGAENIFFKIDLDIRDPGPFCFEEPGWVCAMIQINAPELDAYYDSAEIQFKVPEGDSNYIGAEIANKLPYIAADDYIGIELNNLGTGNKYVDSEVHARLYSVCRFEHAYDNMLLPIKSSFYIGIHTTDTRRNQYAVNCKIGTIFKEKEDLTEDDKKLIPYCP